MLFGILKASGKTSVAIKSWVGQGDATASPDKTGITIMLDKNVIDAFRERPKREGRGYQTAINDALRAVVQADNASVAVGALRRELTRALKHVAAWSR